MDFTAAAQRHQGQNAILKEVPGMKPRTPKKKESGGIISKEAIKRRLDKMSRK